MSLYPRLEGAPRDAVAGGRANPLMTRHAWVDRAKGIAILLVVAQHVVQLSAEQQWASDAVIYANTMLQSFRMPLFFAMSGLFFTKAAAQPWRWLFANRVLPFVYLYVIWAVIWHACFEAMPVERAGLGLDYLAAEFLDPGVGPWYIYALCLYFIAAKLLSPLPVWVQLTLVAAVSIPVAVRLVALPWGWEYICMYSLAFFAGMHGARLLMEIAARTTWVTVVGAAAGWAIPTAGVYLLGWPVGRWLFPPLCAAGIVLGVTLAAFLDRASPLAWFGRRTLPIYLLHQPLIGAIYSIGAVRSLPDEPWVAAVALLCAWALTVLASVAIWRLAGAIPGLFTAPWYGSGTATMSRPTPEPDAVPTRSGEI